jgi:hypothetical protein
MIVQQAYVGALGCDTDTRLSVDTARALCDNGLAFVLRYLSLGTESPGDLTTDETQAILTGGLALMAVQHVRMPGWLPNGPLGVQDGSHAASNAVSAGLPAGVSIWLDLEGVASMAVKSDVVAYCNAWDTAVRHAGYSTGLYVGAGQPLDEAALYSLQVSRYWRSQSQVPNVEHRGYCMIQLWPTETVGGVSIDYDVIQSDYKGGLPRWVVVS